MSKTVSVRSARKLPDLLTADEVAAWLKTTVQAVYAKAERASAHGFSPRQVPTSSSTSFGPSF